MRRSQMRARATLLVAAATLAASAVGASVAAASAPPNPVWGGSGACNMVNQPPAPHMLGNPVQSGPGLAGMFNAMFMSAGVQGADCPNLPS
jgi:hypothetical protein